MSHTVTPVTVDQFRAGFREARRRAFSRSSAAVFTGVCPMCGKVTGGSAVYVNTNRAGTAILTTAEAKALPEGEVRGTYVGQACFKKLGADYISAVSAPERITLTGEGKIATKY